MTTTFGWQRASHGAGLLGAHGALTPSIFAEMSALSVASGALNLGQGFPDEDGPAEILELARTAIAEGHNQYPPGIGIPALRAAIATHQERFYGLRLDPDREILVTTGATEALAASILALTEPGDEVVTFEPFYDAYGGLISLAGARHVTVPLEWPAFAPDPERLRAAISDRTRIILLNTPHNPTGAVTDRATLELIVELAHRHDALILTDEVYEHLLFDGRRHEPIATLPGAAERTITISSGGKTFNTTGWKIGWLSGPATLVSRVTAVKQFLSYVSGAPFQPAIAAALALPDSYFLTLASDLQAKRDLLAAGLTAAGFTVSLPTAGYFIVADAAPLGHGDATALARALPGRIGVAAIPVGAFVHAENAPRYGSLLRFAFSKRPEVLHEAVSRLASL